MRWLSLFVALALSCTDALPCSNCPAIEGDWQLQSTAPRGSGCGASAPPVAPATLHLTRQGSGLTCTVDGVPLSGTLYDTYDFTLHGIDPGDATTKGRTVDVRGTYLPGSRPDAGDASLVGTLTRTQQACRQDVDFNGLRR